MFRNVVCCLFTVGAALSAVLFCCPLASAQGEDQTYTVGQIYYFGYAGIDMKPVRERVAVHLGDALREGEFPREEKIIATTITSVTGEPPTGVAEVCCDGAHHLFLFIGMNGTSSRRMTTQALPVGRDHLDQAALKLFQHYQAANQRAVNAGVAGEDDSLGYAVADYPEARQVELAMLAYAIHHGPKLEAVLHHAADVQQRRASAALLGYTQRSSSQIDALAHAANDADSLVRNNAVRALEVLAGAKDATGINVNPEPFIDLLFSEHWTDRNKGSFLLEKLSRNGDPVFLAKLRSEALLPLLEGAAWDSGHAYPFLELLKRIGCPAGSADAPTSLAACHAIGVPSS